MNFFIFNPLPVPRLTDRARRQRCVALAGRLGQRRQEVHYVGEGGRCRLRVDRRVGKARCCRRVADAVVAHCYGLSGVSTCARLRDIPRTLGFQRPAKKRTEPLRKTKRDDLRPHDQPPRIDQPMKPISSTTAMATHCTARCWSTSLLIEQRATPSRTCGRDGISTLMGWSRSPVETQRVPRIHNTWRGADAGAAAAFASAR